MKKLLITATLAAATLGSTALLASPAGKDHRHEGQSKAGCVMTQESGKAGHAERSDERHAQMQKHMEQMHARMAVRETQEEHQH